jgi:hypothetical protein
VKRTLKKDSKEPEIVKRETDVANNRDDSNSVIGLQEYLYPIVDK